MRSISLRSLNGRVPRPTRFHRPWETVTAQVFRPPGLRSYWRGKVHGRADGLGRVSR